MPTERRPKFTRSMRVHPHSLARRTATFAVPPLMTLLASCSTVEYRGAAVTPQRPTFSSNTQTTLEGTFELEAGAVIDTDDAHEIQTVAKYGLHEATEVFVGFSPFKQVARGSGNTAGIGDLTGGVRHRVQDPDDEEGAPGVALLAAVKIPTADADRGLGNGDVDLFVAGSVEQNLEDVDLVGYYQLGIVGEGPGGGTPDLQHGVAVAASTAVLRELSVFAELADVWRPERDLNALFLTAGLVNLPLPSLAFDLSASVGLSSDAPDFQVLLGVTVNFGAPR